MFSNFASAAQGRTVKPVGDPNAKIAIIGDTTDNSDALTGNCWGGMVGSVLESCLHAAGLIRGECYLTSLVKTPPSGTMRDKKGNYNAEFFTVKDNGSVQFTPKGETWKARLRDEILSINANVLVAAGPAAFAALVGGRKLSTYRGYLYEGVVGNGTGYLPYRKVLPTFSPQETIRGQYINRTIISIDLQKAKAESEWPEIRRPNTSLIYQFDNLGDCLRRLEYIALHKIVSVDIEVVNYEVASISFAVSPDCGVAVPLDERWTLEDEVYIWRAFQRILGDESIKKVGQNLIFDIQFLLTKGLVVRGEIEDTMIGHSVMYPELMKGLGFLGSIYCGAAEFWKDLVKFDDVKEES